MWFIITIAIQYLREKSALSHLSHFSNFFWFCWKYDCPTRILMKIAKIWFILSEFQFLEKLAFLHLSYLSIFQFPKAFNHPYFKIDFKGEGVINCGFRDDFMSFDKHLCWDEPNEPLESEFSGIFYHPLFKSIFKGKGVGNCGFWDHFMSLDKHLCWDEPNEPLES